MLRAHADEIGSIVGPGRSIVEFGAGSSTKTPVLIEAVAAPSYVPIDVSGEFLIASSAALARKFPGLAIHPLVANFGLPLKLPSEFVASPVLGFFPGSTIGNMSEYEAVDLLRRMGDTLGAGAMLLIGMDRVKPESVLVPAYDDARGVTAEFNLNLLHRINRDLDGDIPVQVFEHRAIWNGERSRIEMHLVAKEDVAFTVADRRFSMRKGETIHTENSRKYRPEEATVLLRAGGWSPVKHWTDERAYFSLILARSDVPPKSDASGDPAAACRSLELVEK